MTAELSALELAISDVVADPVLYAESFLYVRTKDQDITPFYLNTVQKRSLEKELEIAFVPALEFPDGLAQRGVDVRPRRSGTAAGGIAGLTLLP